MYAVLVVGGKQYKVEKGTIFKIEKIDGEVGSKVNFDSIVMLSDGNELKIGTPYIDSYKIYGRIVGQKKYKKIVVFKYKKRKRYRKKNGHRQCYTSVVIDDIRLV